MRKGLWLFYLPVIMLGCRFSGYDFQDDDITGRDIERAVQAAPYPELTPKAERNLSRESKSLSLEQCLKLALRNNLDFLSDKEALDIELLSLQVLRHNWGPTLSDLSGSVTASSSNPGGASRDMSLGASLSQKLPFGGSGSLDYSHSGGGGRGGESFGGYASATLTIPLLKGGGWLSAREELISAERGYIYSRRNLEFNRTGLLIATAESYFGLLREKREIQNVTQKLESAKRLLRQSEIRHRFGHVTKTDVFRAQLQVTNVENQLLVAEERYRIAIDAFKIDLGLEPRQEVVLVKKEIEFKPMKIDPEQAITEAQTSNPAWLTLRDQFQDSRRSLMIAKRDTLPEVDLNLSFDQATDERDRLMAGYDTASRGWAVGLAFSIPFDRTALRAGYQAAVIHYRQAERSIRRAEADLVRRVRSMLIGLRQSELTMKHEKRAIDQAEKTLRLVSIDYRNGKATNQDVIDAQNGLLEAQNNYQRARVDSKIQQLRVLHFIGRLKADESGDWLK